MAFTVRMTIEAIDETTGKQSGKKTWEGNGLNALERNHVQGKFQQMEDELLTDSNEVNAAK